MNGNHSGMKSEIGMRDRKPARRAPWSGLAVVMGGLVAAAIPAACHGETAAASYASPEAGVAALIAASRGGEAGALEAILGPGSRPLVESGDAVADREGRQNFVAAYDRQHRIDRDGEARAVLIVGPDDWPMPIPLVRQGGAWQFDASAGTREILDRRIGRNERSTLRSCHAYVEAQREYAALDRQADGLREYAQRFMSSDGRHDGLYWPVSAGDAESPIGPLVADARAEGYPAPPQNAPPIPYHGYFFRILTRQGGHASGGAHDYVVQGHMIGGFALIAYPASWGDSGIMSFTVGPDGKVFERNLGPDTARIAAGIAAFDPDSSWKPAEP